MAEHPKSALTTSILSIHPSILDERLEVAVVAFEQAVRLGRVVTTMSEESAKE